MSELKERTSWHPIIERDAEIERLRALNGELVVALEDIIDRFDTAGNLASMRMSPVLLERALAAIAKAKSEIC